MGNVCAGAGSTTRVDAPTTADKAKAAVVNAVDEAIKPAAAADANGKQEPAVAAPPSAEPVPEPTQTTAEIEAKPEPPAKKTKIFIIYYSTYGHIRQLALTCKSVLDTIDGVEASLFQVKETLPTSVLEKMQAPPKSEDPIIDPHNLPEADAFIFGFPTRFGMMASQMKNFFDATGALWQNGALHGKPATMFTSTATQGGGQETTIMTAITQLAHHGMIYVPAGYAAGGAMFGMTEAKGGSPWGAGTLAGPDGSRQPIEAELEAAKVQAKLFADVAIKLSK